MKKRLLFMASVVGTCFGSSAEAQDSERRFQVNLTNRLVHDSNIYRTDDLSFAPPDATKEDFKNSPRLEVDIAVPFGLQSAFLNGSLGYDFHRNNKRFDREAINLSGGLNLRAGSECSSRLATQFRRQQSDVSDFRSLLNVENTEEQIRFGASISCKRAIGLTSSIGYDYDKAVNSDIRRSSGEYRSNGINASLGYAHPALGEVAAYTNFRRGSYPGRREIFSPTQAERVDIASGGIRFSRDIGRQLKGSVSLGYTSVDPNTPGVRKFKGASYSADITVLPNESLQANIGILRDVQQSSILDVTYFITTNYHIDARYALSPQWQLSAGASHTKRDFRESPLVPVAFARGKDSTSTVFAGANFTPPGRVSFNFDLSATDRNSANRQLRYNNVIAALTVRYRFR